MDALGGGNLWLLRQGIDLAGFSDKLPDPSIGAGGCSCQELGVHLPRKRMAKLGMRKGG